MMKKCQRNMKKRQRISLGAFWILALYFSLSTALWAHYRIYQTPQHHKYFLFSMSKLVEHYHTFSRGFDDTAHFYHTCAMNALLSNNTFMFEHVIKFEYWFDLIPVITKNWGWWTTRRLDIDTLKLNPHWHHDNFGFWSQIAGKSHLVKQQTHGNFQFLQSTYTYTWAWKFSYGPD